MADDLSGVDPRLAAIAQRIIAESGGRIWITSGFRSRAEQEALYQKYKSGQGNLAAKPGTSMHEHGGAIDFGGDMALLRQLGTKYGLNNSVPGEPWHWTLDGEGGRSGLDNRHEQYDLSDDHAADPQEVIANRLNSVLRIMGQGATSNMQYGDPSLDQAFQRGDTDGMEVVGQLDTPGHPAAATPKGALQKYAQQKLSEMGMSPEDIGSLITLWNKESGWDPNAQNPTSTAYGIAQFLNGTWESTGHQKTSDPYKQIDAGLTYIMNRYGSPSRALEFHKANNWY